MDLILIRTYLAVIGIGLACWGLILLAVYAAFFQ